jgi:hypothetical protein
MRMNLKTVTAGAVLALTITAAATLPAAAANATTPNTATPHGNMVNAGALTSTLTGTYTDTTGGTGTLTGTFTPTRFSTQENRLLATGLVTGQLIDSTGTTQSVSQTATLPVNTTTTGVTPQAAAPTINCQVLDLVLGPLDLNLLGLTVHLNQVHLNITAVPGAGNLLGNLLCAVAGLLNGNGPLTQITTLLNQILNLLGLTG